MIDRRAWVVYDPTEYTKKNYYLGNPNIKRFGTKTDWTPELIEEYKRCMNSCEYFATNYVKIIDIDKGLQRISPFDYQKNMWQTFSDNRFTIVLAARQSGKTVAAAIFLLWWGLFHADQTIALVAHKAAQAREILSRISLYLENLPFFVQQGVRELNKGSITFENNTKIFAEASESASLRGRSVSLLYIDEMAFIGNDVEFMAATYPVISSGKNSRVIITSSAGSLGALFTAYWEQAIKGKNEFVPIEVHWSDVPGRDDEWERVTRANSTSDREFEREFCNKFTGDTGMLIDAAIVLKMIPEEPEEEHEHGKLRVYELPKEECGYVMTVDVSHGKGLDYSTFSIFKLELPFEQVAVFRSGDISPLLLPEIAIKWAKKYNNAQIVVENNDIGTMVVRDIHEEYDNIFKMGGLKLSDLGVKVTKRVKSVGCAILRDLIEGYHLKIVDKWTIDEIKVFEQKGQTFQARDKYHDDIMSNLWLFAWWLDTNSADEMFDVDKMTYVISNALKSIDEAEKDDFDDTIPVGILGNLEDKDDSVDDFGDGLIWTKGYRV
jgi:hypothetical protein